MDRLSIARLNECEHALGTLAAWLFTSLSLSLRDVSLKIDRAVAAAPTVQLPSFDNVSSAASLHSQYRDRASVQVTARNGSKAVLARLLNLSQSNMAHRLHGKKRMDDAETRRFTNALGLPEGWLDTPRAAADIPDVVDELLLPTSRRQSRDKHQATEILITRSNGSAQEHPVQSAVEPAQAVDEANGVRHTSGAPRTPVLAEGMQDRATAVAAPSGKLFNDDAVTENAFPSTSATDLDTLRGIAPIAEALLKTLAGKARMGRSTEAAALQLLQQVVAI